MRIFLCVLCLSAACFSCQNELQKKAAERAEIKALEQQLAAKMDTSTYRLDKNLAQKMVEKSEAFAAHYPKDTAAAELLFRAADVARGAGNFEKAIALWGNVNTHFAEAKKAPDALFLQAFSSENDLNDKEAARKYYTNFLQKYPSHPMATQVNQLLSMLDQSPEEVIKKFQEMNEMLNTK